MLLDLVFPTPLITFFFRRFLRVKKEDPASVMLDTHASPFPF